PILIAHFLSNVLNFLLQELQKGYPAFLNTGTYLLFHYKLQTKLKYTLKNSHPDRNLFSMKTVMTYLNCSLSEQFGQTLLYNRKSFDSLPQTKCLILHALPQKTKSLHK